MRDDARSALPETPPARHRPLRIGLTGPIGCGKSTVAGWLRDEGAVVIDADAVAREATALGEPALAAVLDRFGPAFRRPDGSLDRAALGRLVFADPEALAALERIVHPVVRARIRARLTATDQAVPPPTLVVVEAIKLVEAGYPALLDEVWFVTCPPGAQLARLTGRGMAAADAAQRVAAQSGLGERVAPAVTRVVDTDGSVAEARARVTRALAEALAGA